MKWSRVKWLLIFCLLAADIFLGIRLLYGYRGVYTVSGAAQEDASALLAQAGIAVSPEVIPDAAVPDFVYRFDLSPDTAENAVPEEETEEGFSPDRTEPVVQLLTRALASLSGGTVSAHFLLPDSTGSAFAFSNGGSAVCYPNFYVSYTCAGASDGQEAVDSFLASPENFSPYTGRGAKQAQEAAALFLEGYTGLDLSDSTGRLRGGTRVRMRAHPEGVYSRGDTVIAVFSEEIGRGAYSPAVIAGTEVYVVLEGGEVRYFCGTWMPFLPSGTYRVEKLGQLDILFSEKKRFGGNGEHEVSAMERRYYMLWDDAGHVFLRPAWQLDYTEETVVCDAVNGSVMLQTYHTGTDTETEP